MTIKEINKTKIPIVKINKTLDKLAEKVLFPDKLEDANNILKTVGLPKTKSHIQQPTIFQDACKA